MPPVLEAIDKLSMTEKVEVMDYLWKAVFASGGRFVPVWTLTTAEEVAKPAPKHVSQYGALKDKITYMAPDFDGPLEDFAEYM